MRATLAVALVALVGGAAAAVGYHRGGDDRPEEAPARYFAAIEAHDCARLAAVSTGTLARALEQRGCGETIREVRAHRVKYLGARRQVPDGRDPRARLVTIDLTFAGKPRVLQVRVQDDRGTWKLATL
jgi:hypothetical protein